MWSNIANDDRINAILEHLYLGGFMPSQKSTVKHFVIFGDSLSERARLAHKHIFGIPLADIAGLKGNSPKGRFTNGYAWSDVLCANMASELLKEEIKAANPHDLDSADIADDIITHAPDAQTAVHSYSLNRGDTYIGLNGVDFVRTYAEGGASSHNYHGDFSLNPVVEGSRLILSNLDHQRARLIRDDERFHVTPKHKAETLVTEWTGANDLITENHINSHTSQKKIEAIVKKAVQARLHNIQEMMANGYRHFMVIDLPDLALTPKYRAMSKNARTNVTKATELFNLQLKKGLDELKSKNPNSEIHLFEASKQFKDIYDNYNNYDFDSRDPYVKSKAYKTSKDHMRDSEKHMFWDDVHPSAHMHRLLADRMEETVNKLYNIEKPTLDTEGKKREISEEVLVDEFLHAYHQRLQKEKRGIFGHFRKSQLQLDSEHLKLDDIIYHALYDRTSRGHFNRTHQVLCDMGYFKDALANDVVNVPAFIEAVERVKASVNASDNQNADKDIDPSASSESLINNFIVAYKEKYYQDKRKFGGVFRTSHMMKYIGRNKLSLDVIFKHALLGDGERSRLVLRNMGWIDNHNQLTTDAAKNPLLRKAHAPYFKLYKERQHELNIAAMHAATMR